MKKITLVLLVVCTATMAVAHSQTSPAKAPSWEAQDAADGAFVARTTFAETDGEKMYRRVCAACHMPDGKGAEGAGRYPALANNPRLATGAYSVMVILKGLNGMPPIGSMMSDQQVADVVNYTRAHMGNKYTDLVTAAEVKEIRETN